MKKYIQYFLLLFLFSGIFSSCSKMLDFEPDPEEAQLLSDMLKTPEDMRKLLVSSYDASATAYYGRQQNLAELLSDDLNPPNTHNDYNEVYIRNTIFFNNTIRDFYRDPYVAILRTNVVMENFVLIEGLTPEEQTIFEAEARFIRAINHFEVLNLFAQPFIPNSDNSQLGIVMKDNSDPVPPPRSSVAVSYNFILDDLLFAEQNLPENNDIYATKWAAAAMLARVYFQMNNFEKAAEFASKVIDNGPFSIGPVGVYDRWSLDISSENIFTFVILDGEGRNNAFGNYRSDNTELPTLTASVAYYNELYGDGENANPLDNRKNWFEFRQVGSQDPFYAVTKFNQDFFNIPYLNLTETLLIRAESLAEMGTDLGTAISDINQLRTRAGISPISDGSTAENIIAIARTERRKEFFGEGRLVFDQKRQGAKGDLELIRGVAYDCNGMVLQFPVSENVSNFIPNPSGGCN